MNFTDDIHAGEVGGFLNITSRSRDPRARLLSALANRPFEMMEAGTERWFASLEGWYQGIKFSPQDPRRERAFASCFGHAKAFSAEAERRFIWWESRPYTYAGQVHKELIEAAFRASFPKGGDREKALLDTIGLKLVHETNEPDASDSPLTKVEFAELLTRIRIERRVAQRVTR